MDKIRWEEERGRNQHPLSALLDPNSAKERQQIIILRKGGETEEEQPTALAFSMPHMLNMDAIFGIDGSVERDDEDTALSPNSYGITIASFKETKRM